MRLEGGAVARLERHLARMAGSARYFGYPWDDGRVRAAVGGARAAHADGCWRLRLTVDADGTPAVGCSPHESRESRPWTVALAADPIDGRDPFLLNKTTRRDCYDAARRARPDADEVLLWNERGEVTEATVANLVAELDGVRVTPPIGCGLLAGTLRAELLEDGTLHERVLTRDEVTRATRLWLINSLRGWIEASLIP
jgi:para-aminobenzoate synthetase/4-amino-4-deoxychorismate lyase